MTTKFRLESVSLDTTEGKVKHSFPGALTVLAGSVGVGKSTLFELVKYGLGGDGLLADVVITSITSVTLDVAIGSERYSITRSTSSPASRTVRLRDLTEQIALPEHFVGQEEPSLNSLLLAAMDLPDDMRAATTKPGSTNPGARITFYDVFKYMYVSQGSINEQIAGSGDNYYQPKRRAVFELLFGLTNPNILDIQSEIAAMQSEYELAKRDFEVVAQFLSDSQTESRLETERSQFEATKEKYRAEQALIDIEGMISPVVDEETRTLRDLLLESERNAAEAQNTLTLLVQQKRDFVRERSLLQQDIERLKKMIDAGERIAKIEFAVCPRCMQDVRKRPIPEHACRLCLQDDPVALSAEVVDSGSNYELVHLAEQVAEFDAQIFGMEIEIDNVSASVSSRQHLVEDLSVQINSRTSKRITPQLQAYSDTTANLARAESLIKGLEKTLRQWDRADDLESKADGFQDQLTNLRARLLEAQSVLDFRKIEILDEIDAEFGATVAAIGIPSVQVAAVNRKNYLPTLNGKAFDKFSPVGGVRTATQVAYWVSLLTVAIRRRDTQYPAFLLIDSPRTSLNDSDDLSSALYRRLVTMADAAGGRVQVIIGDNELPAHYRRDYAQLDFDYDHPTIYTIHHPGRESVDLINNEADASD